MNAETRIVKHSTIVVLDNGCIAVPSVLITQADHRIVLLYILPILMK